MRLLRRRHASFSLNASSAYRLESFGKETFFIVKPRKQITEPCYVHHRQQTPDSLPVSIAKRLKIQQDQVFWRGDFYPQISNPRLTGMVKGFSVERLNG